MRRVLLGVGLVLVLIAGWQLRQRLDGRGGPAEARIKRPALTVVTSRVRILSMPVQIHAVGQVESEHSVAVRAQVSGVLTRVAFAEGSDVKAGQLLFQIDPAPFRAAVAQARAAIARDRASLSNARWQVQRLAPLVKLDYVTPQEYESAKTAEAQARAAIEADKAQLEQAQIQLGYTTIRSPIDGRAGAVSVKAGNLVDASAATPLVTLNQISPILVRFSVPQSQLDTVRRYARRGPIAVRLAGDRSDAPDPGRLVFIDNTVDPSTGTVTLKAEFPNRSRQLWPGQYAAVDLQLAVQKGAIVIPETAVQPGQSGPFVYVVKKGRVAVQSIQVARQQDGDAIVGSGLSGGETVVVQVPRNLREGLPVVAVPVSGGSQ